MKMLSFTLPSFLEITWASPELRETWAPAFAEAPQAGTRRHLEAITDGVLPATFLAMAPYQAPALMRQARERHLASVIVSRDESRGKIIMPGLLPSSLIMAVGTEATLAMLQSALSEGTTGDVLVASGWPECCAEAHAKREFADPVWRFIGTGTQKREAATPWHPFLQRLGIGIVRHISCGPDCQKTQELAQALRRNEPLDEIMSWPIVWSGLHGIAEVLTPAAKIIHDTDPSAARSRFEVSSDHLPKHTPPGHVAPYRKTKRTPLRQTRGFQNGLVSVISDPPPLPPRIPRNTDLTPTTLPDQPTVMENVGKHWPALKRWNMDFLMTRFGNEKIIVSRDREKRCMTFGTFADDVMAGKSRGWYLTDFGFESAAPDMTDDFVLPPILESWHYLLPPEEQPGLRSLYFGGADSGVSLHVDILHTCAFNTLIFGDKHWYFCPPTSHSAWLESEPDLFDPKVRKNLYLKGLRIYEHVQKPGETIFVPSGWWHQTQNRVRGLSLTGNLLNEKNAENVTNAAETTTVPVLQEIGRKLVKAIALAKNR